jgi:hypothetical protein
LRQILTHPELGRAFRSAAVQIHAAENIAFVDTMTDALTVRDSESACMDVYDRFIKPGAADQLNLSGKQREDIEDSLTSPLDFFKLMDLLLADMMAELSQGDLLRTFIASNETAARLHETVTEQVFVWWLEMGAEGGPREGSVGDLIDTYHSAPDSQAMQRALDELRRRKNLVHLANHLAHV